jgi:hypothetical protein
MYRYNLTRAFRANLAITDGERELHNNYVYNLHSSQDNTRGTNQEIIICVGHVSHGGMGERRFLWENLNGKDSSTIPRHKGKDTNLLN